jgi:hypothetical protein
MLGRFLAGGICFFMARFGITLVLILAFHQSVSARDLVGTSWVVDKEMTLDFNKRKSKPLSDNFVFFIKCQYAVMSFNDINMSINFNYEQCAIEDSKKYLSPARLRYDYEVLLDEDNLLIISTKSKDVPSAEARIQTYYFYGDDLFWVYESIGLSRGSNHLRVYYRKVK